MREGRGGDFAVLKADLLGARAAPSVAAMLDAVKGYRPKIDLDALKAYPDGTFGRAYADWMVGRRLTPIEVSDELADVADRNVFALRYAVTHDMFHVLTGFDTSLAGEIGVLAFAEAQGYAKEQSVALAFATALYPVLKPWGAREIFAAKAKGREMGLRADFLLGERLEDRFPERLDAVRRDLGIDG